MGYVLYGMSFMNLNSESFSAEITAVMYTVSYHIGLHTSTRLYDVTCILLHVLKLSCIR